jgi:hypothetical protein
MCHEPESGPGIGTALTLALLLGGARSERTATFR